MAIKRFCLLVAAWMSSLSRESDDVSTFTDLSSVDSAAS